MAVQSGVKIALIQILSLPLTIHVTLGGGMTALLFLQDIF